MGERRLGVAEVRGSSPLPSIVDVDFTLKSFLGKMVDVAV